MGNISQKYGRTLEVNPLNGHILGDPEAAGEKRVDFEVLQEMAKRASGKFFTPDDQESLLQVYQEIDAAMPREIKAKPRIRTMAVSRSPSISPNKR